MKLFIIVVLVGFSAFNAYGCPELLEAAKSRDTAEVTSLIDEAGTHVDFQDEHGRTALMWAVYYGYFDIAQILIDADANLDIQDKDGNTVLMVAARGENHHAVVQTLMEAGASLNTQDITGWTALMSAAYDGNFRAMQILIDFDADLDIQGQSGHTALMSAILGYAFSKRGIARYMDTLKALIEAGASLNIQNEDGNTALKLAVWSEQSHAAQTLVDAGADESMLDKLYRLFFL